MDIEVALPGRNPSLQLTIRHRCQHKGCTNEACRLCRNNPHRKCSHPFREEYISAASDLLSGQMFTAQCGADIELVLLDGEELANKPAPGRRLELCLVDAKLFNHQAARKHPNTFLEAEWAPMLRLNREGAAAAATPLLLLGKDAPGHYTRSNKLQIPFEESSVVLQCLASTSQDKSGGRRKQLRLLARVVNAAGQRVPNISFAISEEFAVLSRRMKSEVKPSIPAETDPVGRLKHVGTEATQKLKNPRAAGWNFEKCPIDNRPIELVRELVALIKEAQEIGMQREFGTELGRLLRTGERRTAELIAQAQRMVSVDDRPRVWCHPNKPGISLLYDCKAAAPMLEVPCIDTFFDGPNGGIDDLTKANLISEYRRLADYYWWQDDHPGWDIWQEHPGTAVQAPVLEGRWQEHQPPSPPSQLDPPWTPLADSNEGPSAWDDESIESPWMGTRSPKRPRSAPVSGYQSGQDVVDSSPLAAISRRTSTPARITQTPQEEIQSPRHDELRRLYASASPIYPQMVTPWGCQLAIPGSSRPDLVSSDSQGARRSLRLANIRTPHTPTRSGSMSVHSSPQIKRSHSGSLMNADRTAELNSPMQALDLSPQGENSGFIQDSLQFVRSAALQAREAEALEAVETGLETLERGGSFPVHMLQDIHKAEAETAWIARVGLGVREEGLVYLREWEEGAKRLEEQWRMTD